MTKPRSRRIISRAYLAKLAAFVKSIGATSVEFSPNGAVKVTLANGETLASERELAEIERQQDRIGQHGKWPHRMRQAPPSASAVFKVQQRTRENFGDVEERRFKEKWAFLGEDKIAEAFSRLNPNWTGPGEPYEWPAGTHHSR